MKDFLGNTLYEGDEVIYVRKMGCDRHMAKLTSGKIVNICEQILRVDNDSGYVRPYNVILKSAVNDKAIQ